MRIAIGRDLKDVSKLSNLPLGQGQKSQNMENIFRWTLLLDNIDISVRKVM